MTDLELLDKYCDTCAEFIQPLIFREVQSRGLLRIVDHLGTKDPKMMKSLVRGRLARMGRYIGDPEIEHIASIVDRLEYLRNQLNAISMTDAVKVNALADEMNQLSSNLLNWYK